MIDNINTRVHLRVMVTFYRYVEERVVDSVWSRTQRLLASRNVALRIRARAYNRTIEEINR